MDSGLVKYWKLEPENEYRFELDPGESLAIKLAGMLKYLEPNSRKVPLTSLIQSAKQLYSPGTDASSKL